MLYDALNRETSRSVPDNAGVPGNFARTLSSTYDLASRPWNTTADGQTLRSRYDAAGRLLRVEDSLLNALGGTIGNVEYTYDPASNRKTMLFYTSGTSWTQTYHYDTGERLYQIKNGVPILRPHRMNWRSDWPTDRSCGPSMRPMMLRTTVARTCCTPTRPTLADCSSMKPALASLSGLTKQ
jgi:hypothetical protein